ncbi:hypothetical protein PQX77_011125 [Marasmius sp. AFHP31]|nr:hypothetical protein PQX77_011125 [Marasmius sp. AFHP31]
MMVVFEFSSAILTIARCIQAFRVGGPWKKQKRGFIYLVFEQGKCFHRLVGVHTDESDYFPGLIYFCIVSILTTGAMILNFRAPSGSFFQRLLNALTLPISGLLTARFLLHIRRWSDERSQMPPSLSHPLSQLPGSSSSSNRDGALAFEDAVRATTTTFSFRGTLSTIIEDFGDDPVDAARNHEGASPQSPESPNFARFLREEAGRGTAIISLKNYQSSSAGPGALEPSGSSVPPNAAASSSRV